MEAAKRSGALITADYALEQGREVYAIPGKIDSLSSSGVNNLIKQGAKIITSIDDVLEDLHPQLVQNKDQTFQVKKEKSIKVSISDLSEEEKAVFNYIGKDPLHIDEISTKAGSKISPTTAILLKLELKHLVKQLPGQRYIR